MPRIARALIDDHIYHIINRGNRQAEIFHDKHDYEKFLDILLRAKERFELAYFGYCLMPNHYHLVLHAARGSAIGEAMQWIGTSYVRYYNQRYSISGHLWQGRYKSFIVQYDSYLLALLRYVDTNPTRAKLQKKAWKYPYSSAHSHMHHTTDALLDTPPITMPDDYKSMLLTHQEQQELDTIRTTLNRQAPLGTPEWVSDIAAAHGLESTLRPRGRPKK